MQINNLKEIYNLYSEDNSKVKEYLRTRFLDRWIVKLFYYTDKQGGCFIGDTQKAYRNKVNTIIKEVNLILK